MNKALKHISKEEMERCIDGMDQCEVVDYCIDYIWQNVESKTTNEEIQEIVFDCAHEAAIDGYSMYMPALLKVAIRQRRLLRHEAREGR